MFMYPDIGAKSLSCNEQYQKGHGSNPRLHFMLSGPGADFQADKTGLSE